MNRRFQRRYPRILIAALFAVSTAATAGEHSFLPDVLRFANPTGYAETHSAAGKVDLTGPFFQSLGANGRACVSCHQPSVGWTVTPADAQARRGERVDAQVGGLCRRLMPFVPSLAGRHRGPINPTLRVS